MAPLPDPLVVATAQSLLSMMGRRPANMTTEGRLRTQGATSQGLRAGSSLVM